MENFSANHIDSNGVDSYQFANSGASVGLYLQFWWFISGFHFCHKLGLQQCVSNFQQSSDQFMRSTDTSM
ncbi:hypothetical protein O6P43_029874 [Quillaja saponaria]|uniref:Uncharacterized protein n=1 Tax=Quillaja saponaria TaxID=32244 RepID=A0AAD7L0W2_QUISA|nr:hypothetical protein O6P43_029874 [Quillaja saponaria]